MQLPRPPVQVFTHHRSTLLLCSLHEQIKLGTMPQDQGQDQGLKLGREPHSHPWFSSVQLLSHVRLCNPMDFSTPGIPVHHQVPECLLKLMSIESVMPSNHLILCRPFLFPPSIFPSIRVLSNKSVLCIRWPKYWSFGCNISSSNEYSGLISFRMDWLDLLAVQETLQESSPTPQFKSINSSALKFSFPPMETTLNTAQDDPPVTRGPAAATGHMCGAGVSAGPASFPPSLSPPACTASRSTTALWSAQHIGPCALDTTFQAVMCPTGAFLTQEAKRHWQPSCGSTSPHLHPSEALHSSGALGLSPP